MTRMQHKGWPARVSVAWIVWVVVGWIALAAAASEAGAQATGVVESVGFDQTVRPGAWTPLVVRIRPDAGVSGTFKLVVEQEDLDRDLISFSRTITLTPVGSGGAGGGGDQRFVAYFLPQGVNTQFGQGLPDGRDGGDGLTQVNEVLRVYLADRNGNRLVKLPVQSTLRNTERVGDKRGSKLVLYVREPGAVTSAPPKRDLSPNGATLMGVVEDIGIVEVSTRGLPTSALGYEGVDAVVWAAGAPPDRSVSTEEPKYKALREWLGRGGRLVVMQHPEWRRTAAWGELLPVTFPKYGDVQGVVQSDELPALLTVAGALDSPEDRAVWTALRGPHNYGVAEARSGAVVEVTVPWARPGLPRESVWMARHGVGAGAVTYVAQDLGAGQLSPVQPPPGWPRIWSRVLDYRYVPTLVNQRTPEAEAAPVQPGRAAYDLGEMVLRRMEQTSRAGALIAISVVFFVVYWLAAGPLSWVVLKMKGKAEWGWLTFAGIAAAATVVTVLVVRVVLRGDPELRHFSLVRVAPGEPAWVEGRVGLYVPRDGNQDISLPPGSSEHVSVVAPYAIHPWHAGNVDQYPSYRRYELGVKESAGEEPATISVPYRSTAKRLQFTWRGELAGRGEAKGPVGLSGAVAIPAPGASQALLTGTLTNNAGSDLKHVWLVYRAQAGLYRGQDVVLYLPEWKDGVQLRLDTLTVRPNMKLLREVDAARSDLVFMPEAVQGSPLVVVERLPLWGQWLQPAIAGGVTMITNAPFDDTAARVPKGWFFLSFFDRMPFWANTSSYTRAELLRLNARFLDASAPVSAGRLVVVAQTPDDQAPPPLSLSVDGDVVAGTGLTVFQFILPIDRTNEREATEDTTPASLPSAPSPAR